MVGSLAILAFAALAAGVAYWVGSNTNAFGGESPFFVAKTIALVSGFGGFCGLASGLLYFWIGLHPDVITRYSIRRMAWKDVDTIRITGSSKFPLLNMVTLEAGNHSLAFPMLIFEDRSAFIAYVKESLPWASEIAMDRLPIEVRRAG